MDFLIAIKAEPIRKSKVTATNKVTLLLSDSAEAADKTILHRDASYNSKLQGTCFSCSKLNANPPQSVCGVIDPPPPPSDCFDISSDPCVCAVCPPPVVPRTCEDGYLPANTAGYGSGYWVGIQANTHYSNIVNGGWVVAVGCATGGIIGAFPVTGSNFGYGTGSIGGHNVMIYPAGSVYGAGVLPQNNTSFPLLGLTTEEGNALIADGAFGSIASGSTTPGTPYTTGQYFCTSEDSSIYSGFPTTCLAKYPRESSGCTDYDNFTEWPSTLSYDTDEDNGENPYFINFGGVTGYDPDVGLSGTISISFSGSSNTYCGAFTGNREPSDPVSGTCGAREFPATPDTVYPNCKECNEDSVKVPCQYLINLTNGSFNDIYGGYSAAGDNGYFAIGPAFPPSVVAQPDIINETPAVLQDTAFWENQWGWSYNGETIDSTGNAVFFPPLGNLLQNCECPSGQTSNQGIVFVESFPCNCACSNPPPTGVGVIALQAPGYSGCGASCASTCPSAKCSCNGIEEGSLGRPSIYGYAPCLNCDCEGQDDPNPTESSESLNTQNANTTIWWAKDGIGLSAVPARNTPEPVSGPCRQRCKDVYAIANPVCATGCVNIVVFDDTTQTITINNSALQNCTGFDNIQDLLDDECARTQYLPAFLKDCILTFQDTPVHTFDESRYPIGSGQDNYQNHYRYNLINYIEVSDCADCSTSGPTDGKKSLKDCLCNNLNPEDCYLSGIGGPFADSIEQGCGGVFLGAVYGCSQPTMENAEFNECNGSCEDPVIKQKLVFKDLQDNQCTPTDPSSEINFDELSADPCGCCGTSINISGGGYLNGDQNSPIPSIGCSGGGENCQADCCQGSGCANSECPLPPEIQPPSSC